MSDSIFGSGQSKYKSPRHDVIQVSYADALRFVKHNYLAQVQNGNFLNPVFLLGHPGVGKTSLVHQAAKELGEHLSKKEETTVEVVLALLLGMDKLDFYGPIIEQLDPNAQVQNRRTRYIPGEGHKILFFDEANRASQGTTNGLLTMFDPKVRAVNDHALGRFVMPVLAGNILKDDEMSMYQGEFVEALNDRITWLQLVLQYKEHYKFLADKYTFANPLVTFLSKNNTFVSYNGGGGITPRRFEEAIKQINGIPAKDLDLIELMLGGIFGDETSSFVMHELRSLESAPNFADVLKGDGATFDWIKTNLHKRIDFVNLITTELRESAREVFNNSQKFGDEERQNVEAMLLLFTSEMRVAIFRTEQDASVRSFIATTFFNRNATLRRELASALDPKLGAA